MSVASPKTAPRRPTVLPQTLPRRARFINSVPAAVSKKTKMFNATSREATKK